MKPTSIANSVSDETHPPIAAKLDVAPTLETSGSNQRWAGRRTAQTPGWILSTALPGSVRCFVRNTSSSGALIQLHADERRMTVDEIPDTFVLAIGSNRAYSEVKCIVARRHADCVGVRYVGHFRNVVKQQQRLPEKKRR
jgi:hypothetical protein